MEFKGTNGKWGLDTDTKNVITYDKIIGDIICEAPEAFEESMINWKANALLISKAPEMFEMLKKLSKHLLNTAEYEIVTEINNDVKKSIELIKEATEL